MIDYLCNQSKIDIGMENGLIGIKHVLLAAGMLLAGGAAFEGEAPQTDTSKLIVLAQNARDLLKEKKIKEADSVVNVAFTKIRSEKNSIPVLLFWAKAEIALSKKDVKTALEAVNSAVNGPKNQIGPQSHGELNILYARILQYAGQFVSSIDILEKNIRIAETGRIPHIRPQTCLVLADVYELVDQKDKSLSSLEDMRRYSLEENDLANAEIACARIGKIRLTTRRDFGLADRYLRQSLDLAKQIGDSTRTAYALTNLAWNYYLEKQLDSSLHYYNLSLRYSIPIGRYSIIANSYGNIGTIYRDRKEYANALSAWMKGIENARLINDWYSISWIYNDMSLMASGTGDYKNAYEYQVLYKQYNDSMESATYNEDLAKARAKFNTDNKEKEVQLLSLRLKNQKLLIYGFAGFLVLSLTIGLLLFRQSKLNTRRRISEMDQKILEITQANLRQQMNPHFIFNTLNSIQYYMYKHDKLATNNYLTKFSNLIRKILENSRHTAVPVRDELDALQLYLELESIRFRDKFDYEITIDEEIDPLMYKIPTMLIQPYVENAISHGLILRKEKGLVKINLTLKKNYLSCIIEDNGIGRDASREINLKKQHSHHSLGTHITESRLKLVNELYGTSLKTIYTDLKDLQGNAAGTRVEIHIPILT